MGVPTILLGGDDITEHVEYNGTTFQSLADGNVGRAVVRIRDIEHTFMPSYLRAGKTLELFIGGTRQWDGWVFGAQRGWPFEAGTGRAAVEEPRNWTLIGLDRNLLFQKRFLYLLSDPADASGIPDFPEDTPDKDAIEAILEDYVDLSGDDIDLSGILEVASPGPFEDFTLGYISAPLGVLFDDAAKITGAVFCIDPGRVLRYVGDTDETAPRPLSDVVEDGATRYREFEAALDATELANDALVWGAGVEGAGFGRHQASNISTYGRWQWGEQYSAGLDLTLERRARTYVEGSPSHRRGHGEPVPVVHCVIHDDGFRAGQVADFRSHLYDYQQNLPIRSITMTFPEAPVVRYELEMTLRVDTPFGIPDLWGLPPIGPFGPDRDPRDEDEDDTGDWVLIDHFDHVPAFEYDVAAYYAVGSVTSVGITPLPGGQDRHYTMHFSLPGAVEDGDLVLFTGVATIDNPPTGITALGIGINADASTGWLIESAAAHFWATGFMRFGASTTSVDFEWDGLEGYLGGEGIFIVVKGKAHASVGPPNFNPSTDFDPEDDFADFPRDQTMVVGTGLWLADSSASNGPEDFGLTTLGDFALSQQITYDWAIARWAIPGDSYVADTYGRLHDGGGGVSPIFAPTVDWWRISESLELRTPYPAVTGADPEAQPGGNLYQMVSDQDLNVADSHLELAPPIGSTTITVVDTGPWGVIDDATGDFSPVEQGELQDGGEPRIPAVWVPFDVLFLYTPSATDTESEKPFAYVDLYCIKLDPDGDDSAIIYDDPYRAAWLSEVEALISVDYEQDFVALDVFTSLWGGTGILPEVHADPSDDFEDGNVAFTKYDEWDHGWTVDLSSIYPPAPGDQWYLRMQAGQEAFDAEAGGWSIRAKMWKKGEPEPDWQVEDVMPMYKPAATEYMGHPNIVGYVEDTSGFESRWIEWDAHAPTGTPPDDSFRIDGWWSRRYP